MCVCARTRARIVKRQESIGPSQGESRSSLVQVGPKSSGCNKRKEMEAGQKTIVSPEPPSPASYLGRQDIVEWGFRARTLGSLPKSATGNLSLFSHL